MATTPPLSTDESPPRSQYSLRALFWLVSVVCGILVALSYARQEWFAPVLGLSLSSVAFLLVGWGALTRNGGRVGLGILLIGIAAISPLFFVASRGGCADSCLNSLRQIHLALQNYESMHGTLPPAYFADENGKPLHSWRVILLPHMECSGLYARYSFDEPWDGPNNRLLVSEMPRHYGCPADLATLRNETSYVAVVGSKTAWPGAESLNRADLVDGAAQTLLVVEVQNSGICWMEPRDLDFATMPMRLNAARPGGISSAHFEGRCHVGYCDGHVERIDNRIPINVLRGLLTKGDGEDVTSWFQKQRLSVPAR